MPGEEPTLPEGTCPFCYSQMELSSGGVQIDTWECLGCGALRSRGWVKLPSPEKLRERSEQLAHLADEIEDSELATRIEMA